MTGTVARGQLRLDELLYTGKENGVIADKFPFPITRADLERGRERYNIYCTPCHDYTGQGNGMIVQRGFPQPPSFHVGALSTAPVGHYFDVMTNGFGVDVQLCGAGRARGPLAHCCLYSGVASEPSREHR